MESMEAILRKATEGLSEEQRTDKEAYDALSLADRTTELLKRSRGGKLAMRFSPRTIVSSNGKH